MTRKPLTTVRSCDLDSLSSKTSFVPENEVLNTADSSVGCVQRSWTQPIVKQAVSLLSDPLVILSSDFSLLYLHKVPG